MEKLRRSDFFGLTVPRMYGGLGLSLRQYLYVVEALVGQNMSLGILAVAHLSIGIKGIVSAARTQFGVPINRFELIQEKMVKADVNALVASAMTAFTAGMLESNPLAAGEASPKNHSRDQERPGYKGSRRCQLAKDTGRARGA